ncbi:MAG: flagellar hook protein FlgE [Bacillota bacterium]|jgi:flagellar hook protein FlgE|nr:flagellar hook-basal body complex protein [Clostridia bacterium]
MMRSLYSAISGLKNHQIYMDVIGNNIANVNTPGYKKNRTAFATMLGQSMRAASAPDQQETPAFGGINGIQIGLGAGIGSVDQIMTQGSAQYTGKDTDMMIEGEGMFVLNLNGEFLYTRSGNFSFDESGNLVEPSTGAILQGYDADKYDEDTGWEEVDSATETVNIRFHLGQEYVDDPDYKLTGYSIDKKGVIIGTYSNGNQTITTPIYRIALANFNNESGLVSMGNNFYTESNNSGKADLGYAGMDGRGYIIPNNLEMSNVDLAQEFTDMIVAQRGFQANSRVITVSDTMLQELIDLKRG